MNTEMPSKLKEDLIKLLTDCVMSYRVRELRECIEIYRPVKIPHKSAKKDYLRRYVLGVLEQMGRAWKGILPLRYITKILELQCVAKNEFIKRYHLLNTSLEIEESPFYEVLHVISGPTRVRSRQIVAFKIPFNWSHLFIQEIPRCTYEIQLFLESNEEGEEWQDMDVSLLKNGSYENRMDVEMCGPVLYVTHFLRDPAVPNALLRNRHQLEVRFPSIDQEDFGVQLTVRIVKRISVPQLIKSYPIVRNCRLSYLLDDFFARTGFMACTVSLFSSFSESIMEDPCRGSGCAHPDVFDLQPFLEQAQYRLRWVCPVCDNPLTYSTLEVDTFFQSFRRLSGKLNYTFMRERMVPFEKGEVITITLD